MHGFSGNFALDSAPFCGCMSPMLVMKDFHSGLCDPDEQTAHAFWKMIRNSKSLKVLDTCWPVPTQYSENQTYGFVAYGFGLGGHEQSHI